MKKGFALLYVVLMIGIISITMTAISVSSVSGLRQARQVKNTTGAYQVAQAGLEQALALRQMGSCNENYSGTVGSGQYIITACDPNIEIKAIYNGNKMGLRANISGADANGQPVVSSVEQIGN